MEAALYWKQPSGRRSRCSRPSCRSRLSSLCDSDSTGELGDAVRVASRSHSRSFVSSRARSRLMLQGRLLVETLAALVTDAACLVMHGASFPAWLLDARS